MATIRFNINDRVRVVLTEASATVLANFEALTLPPELRSVRTPGDVWETEFWRMCRALGGSDGVFHHGVGPIFADNRVEILPTLESA